MACHILGTPNMAMRLAAPTSVECIKQEGKGKYTFPQQTVIRFDFPARGSMPAVEALLARRPEGAARIRRAFRPAN